MSTKDTPSTMRQWTTDQKGIKNIKLEEVKTPSESDLKEGEVLVKITCVSLNYRDTEVCNGTYGHHRSLSQDAKVVPCSDMCGAVIASKSSSLKVGTRVLSTFNQSHLTGQVTAKDLATGTGFPLPGVLTQYRVFPDHALVTAPTHLTNSEASTLPIAFVTAWTSINYFQPLHNPHHSPNTTLLLLGTGGVSIAGVLLGKALGLTTIITSSSDQKLQRAKTLGADHIINYRTTPNWDDKVLELTGDKGADIVFETGGSQTIEKSFNCIAFGGLISAIGYVSGKEESAESKVNVNVLALRRNVTLKGILNGPRDRFQEMIDVAFQEDKGVKPVVDQVFEFEQAREALKYLESGSHFGKVVIKVG
ncbi:hypothetical protein LTR64_006655 [Lithohypha guttulata]|uniref:uncharacterized protein n=1 Tax=Lithohypha guttulata TaxID=1690604 RepID=UPI002DE0F382|nr:hypothetical protein LTR51_004786 [Lithohypha guttulata]